MTPADHLRPPEAERRADADFARRVGLIRRRVVARLRVVAMIVLPQACACEARVRAALRAAVERAAAPLVAEAFLAAVERLDAVRRDAALRAWRASAPCDAALCPSRFNAFSAAFERFAPGFERAGAPWPRA
jgi:hypothetical protein